MTFKEIQELIKLIAKSEIAEFKMKEGDFQLSIRTVHPQLGAPASYPQPAAMAPAPVAAPAAPVAAAVEVNTALESPAAAPEPAPSHYITIKSPMVGTFYRSSSPDKPAFIKVGDSVGVGSPVCIIEAMKLFNEIESEVKGKVVKVMVEDANPVEYDQALFLIDPTA